MIEMAVEGYGSSDYFSCLLSVALNDDGHLIIRWTIIRRGGVTLPDESLVARELRPARPLDRPCAVRRIE